MWMWRFRGLILCVPPRSQRQSIGRLPPDRSVAEPPRYAWPFSLATELDLSSTQSSRRGDAREDALRPCLTCRTLLSTTLAETLTLMYLQQMPDAARRGDAAPYDHS